MSSTEVYAAFEDGDVVLIGRCKNSWRGAIWIWLELGKRYIKPDYNPLFGDPEMKDLFGLLDNPNVLNYEKVVLLTTNDYIFVKREDIQRVAQALDYFSPSTENLQKQASLLREAYDKGARAVCWNATSVNCSPWLIRNGDEDEDEERPFNIDKDFDESKHCYMNLDEIEE